MSRCVQFSFSLLSKGLRRIGEKAESSAYPESTCPIRQSAVTILRSSAIIRMCSSADQPSRWTFPRSWTDRARAAARVHIIRALMIRCFPAVFTQLKLPFLNVAGWMAGCGISRAASEGRNCRASWFCTEWDSPACCAGRKQADIRTFGQRSWASKIKGTRIRSDVFLVPFQMQAGQSLESVRTGIWTRGYILLKFRCPVSRFLNEILPCDKMSANDS